MLTPRDIFQIADRYCDSALLQHAHASGLFELLTAPKTSAQIASLNGWVGTKTEIVLNALVALGVLRREGLFYRNEVTTDAILVKARPGYIGDLIEHERLQWQLWGHMDAVLSSKEAVEGQQDLKLPTNQYANTVFHRAMMQLAHELLPSVVELQEWSNVHQVIDLAGGHGLYLAEIAKRHSSVRGEVWDAPSARNNAEAVIRAYGIEGRVKFLERDIASPTSYAGVLVDAVMLNHCLHHFSRDTVKAIAGYCAQMLPQGGLLVVLDVHLEQDRTKPRENAMFSLYMMVNTVNGQVHPTDDIASLFTEAGFSVEVRLLDSLEGDFLMVGRRT